MLRKIKNKLWGYIEDRIFFRVRIQEKYWIRQFFFNAFKALAYNEIDGDYAEFGSHQGATFIYAFKEAKRHGHKAKFWAFDSFQGLPAAQENIDKHPKWQQGMMTTSLKKFHLICVQNHIPSSEYQVVPGFYADTLTKMPPEDEPNNIALAYIDCDLYSSTKTVLEFLMPRLKHGMIIAFDDYFCWTKSKISGERKAMLEFFTDNPSWTLTPYTQFGWHGNSFIVEKTERTNI